LHTSTFAEDEYSSVVGAACLATIDRDRICERCARTGSLLRSELHRVGQAWPAQIAEVRGRGMILGVEFHEQSTNQSAVLRALDEGHLLTTVIAGFLLHRHDMRILPTVDRQRVLRIEPSAYLDRNEIPRVIEAFREVCAIIEAGDARSLLAPLVRKGEALEPVEIVAQEQASAVALPRPNAL
jgi:acetylornithine/succinyldiaminopimelate/putrescine aminotransferase